MKHIIVGLFITALVGIAPAFGQDKDPKGVVNERKENEKDRIKAGVKDGSLTKAEAAKLKVEQAKVNKDIREARKDGDVTVKERAKINKEQNKLSKDIKQQRTDKQTRK